MQEMEQFYTTRIEQKLDELKQIPPAELGLDSATRKELELRNETYMMLEKELAGNPGNERIRSAMIRYYQMKLELPGQKYWKATASSTITLTTTPHR